MTEISSQGKHLPEERTKKRHCYCSCHTSIGHFAAQQLNKSKPKAEECSPKFKHRVEVKMMGLNAIRGQLIMKANLIESLGSQRGI